MELSRDNSLIGKLRLMLSQHVPIAAAGESARPAAVAIVLRAKDDGADVLLIRRAEYESDPWSGQVAFPGGRREETDADLLDTAIRETREEIGIDLRKSAEVIGRLDDLHPRSVVLPSVIVRPYVMVTHELMDYSLSPEVAEVFWVPWSVLRDRRSWRATSVSARGLGFEVNACHFEGRVIWGMTERILSQLLTIEAGSTGGHR